MTKSAFPALQASFFDVLIPMLKECSFSDERLLNSVKNVIKTCVYPTPTIANFLSYDKKIKLYSYDDMLKLTETDKKAFESHKAIIIYGITLWAHVLDIHGFGLEIKNEG